MAMGWETEQTLRNLIVHEALEGDPERADQLAELALGVLESAVLKGRRSSSTTHR